MSKVPVDRLQPALEVHHVTVRYRGGSAAPAVLDANLKVRPKEIVGVVGQSGSGKSTLGMAVAGLLDPRQCEVSGTMRLGDVTVDLGSTENSLWETLRGSRIGYVFQDAQAALTKFCATNQFPEPVVVSSGRGLHVYWPLKTVLDATRWKAVASGFKRFCIDSGFEIDTSVPADSARVLRMPGTLNFKTKPPAQVDIWGELRTFELSDLEDKFPAPPPDIFEAKQFGVDEFTRSHGKQDYPPTSFVRLVRRSLKGSGCAQIAQAITVVSTQLIDSDLCQMTGIT